MKSVLIAGAGIVGLSTALEMALHGVEVTVLERGTAMREASWAAAGMLAANDPENPPLLAPLSTFSLSLYPDFLQRVEDLSGLEVPLRTSATVQICHPEHTPAAAQLRSQTETLERVPGLHPELQGNLLWLDESSLDPRDLCRALPNAVRAAGVRVIENCTVDAVRVEGRRVMVTTSTADRFATYSADGMVICCGAWSAQSFSLDGKRFDPGLVVPVKGQMLAVRMPAGAGIPSLQVVLRSPDVYLIPRDHPSTPAGADTGRIIIGATVEAAGFDRCIRADATAWLLEKAAALWPPIRSAQVEDAWTGIRPGTFDGLPLIGPMVSADSHPSRVWLATGHYRNGILLAPGTARLVASSMLEGNHDSLRVSMDAFQPSRPLSGKSERVSLTVETGWMQKA